MTRHVIIGGGQAALSAAATLRERDGGASIHMLSAEETLPYQRPPLSKAYLSGKTPLDRILLRPAQWFEEHRIACSLGQEARHIDTAAKSVMVAGGTTIAYDKLLLATGSHPRRLPHSMGGGLGGVFTLRSNEDSDAIRPRLIAGQNLIVIGGGYIGLEAAAIAAECGLKVTIIEIAERILQRVAAPATSDYFRDLHRGHGVTIHEKAAFTHLAHDDDDQVTGVVMADGSVIDADTVLVGIGVIPTEALAVDAGIDAANGIMVDDHCRTSQTDIFAAGDCTNFPFRGGRVRLESVPHAIHQAEIAAINMTGGDEAYAAAPWFWSDQYDVKLQIAGLNTGYTDTIIRPGKREGAQSVWYYRDDDLLAVDAMNDAPAFMMARRLIESGKTVSREVAADPASNLKDYA